MGGGRVASTRGHHIKSITATFFRLRALDKLRQLPGRLVKATDFELTTISDFHNPISSNHNHNHYHYLSLTSPTTHTHH